MHKDKMKHVNWDLTAEKYGYTLPENLRSRSKVIVNCTDCNGTYETSMVKLQPGYIARCNSCRTKAALADPKIRSEMSKRSKVHRSTPEAKKKQAEITKGLWQSDEFRSKVVESLNTEEQVEDNRRRGIENWTNETYRNRMEVAQSDPDYIEKQRRNSLELWNNQEYVDKCSAGLSEAMTSDKVRKLISEAARRLWSDSTYRDKQKATRGTEEFRKAQAERSREMWNKPGFREKITALRTSQEFMARQSAITKALWQDEEYRAKIMGHKSKDSYKQDRSRDMQKLWQDPKYYEHMQAIYSSPEYKEMQSKLGKERWSDQEYRDKISEAMRELWSRPTYRAKMLEALGREEVRSRISASSKAKWQEEGFIQKMAQARANQPRISSIQRTLYKLLGDLDVPFLPEGPETAIGHYVFDCLVPQEGGGGLLIECQGEYWHSLPGADARDRSKFTYVDKYHPEYEVMYLWENEFCTKDRVLDRLKVKLGIEIPVAQFEFKDIQIREIKSAEEVREFLDSYHYIGKGRGGLSFGAYHGDALVGVAVYSSPLRQNTAGQFGVASEDCRELSRFCIHPSYHKKNFASWFISKTIKRVKSDLIVSYADTTAGHNGTIYLAAGFELHHVVDPDYWYVDGEGFVMHKRTLYGRARKMNMTEREYAEKHGYHKQWGGQKHCFIKRK